jgi:signal transduction histidine kinase
MRSASRLIRRRQIRPYHRVVRRLALALTALPPQAQDLLLAVGLTLIDVATLAPYRSQLHPFWAAAALVAAQTLPLAFRSTWPALTFFLVGLPRVSYDLIGLSFAPLPLGPALAFFTVIDRCRPSVRRVITIALILGMITSQTRPGHNEPYDISLSALIFLTAWMAEVLSRTRRAYVTEVEARASRAEAERDAETARAAAAERSRIARELHDVVAHHVSLMAVQAEAASSLLPGRPAEAARSVEIIGTTARQALTELRRLLGVLRRPGEETLTAPTASLADIETVLDQVRDSGLQVDFTLRGDERELSPGTGLTACRIIQEALTNTVRHAQATRAAVTVDYQPGFVTVHVSDSATLPSPGPATLNGAVRPDAEPSGNGAGTPRAGRARPGGARVGGARAVAGGNPGFGLAGIVERVTSCGGTLTVGPTEGGFAVTARLPTP